MHPFRGAEDGIDGAGGDAFCAADADFLIDERNHWLGGRAVRLVKRHGLHAKKLSKRSDGLWSTWRTLVNGFARRDRCCIGPASWMSTLATLGLWKTGIDFRHERRAIDLKTP